MAKIYFISYIYVSSVSFISSLNMVSLSLILRLLFPWTFSVKGFAKAQDGKVNTFLKLFWLLHPLVI